MVFNFNKPIIDKHKSPTKKYFKGPIKIYFFSHLDSGVHEFDRCATVFGATFYHHNNYLIRGLKLFHQTRNYSKLKADFENITAIKAKNKAAQ